jgi:tRNA pseudouridine38-40 synthase
VDKTMQRFVCVLAFKGTKFQGWQTQKEGNSIQEHVEKTLSKILNQTIQVHGASRTDAGVHARGFVFHFDAITSIPLKRIFQGFNRLVDEDILMKQLKKVPQTFQARYQHSKKTYTYQVLTGERNPFLQDFVMHVPVTVNLKNIKSAMRLFVGKHNFQSFTTKKEDGADFIRTIFLFRLAQKESILTFTIQGDGFMTYMVRMMIGTLLALGMDKISLETVKQYLDHPRLGKVSYKAEPQGLCLEKVTYGKKT